jgi:hypothetical protein
VNPANPRIVELNTRVGNGDGQPPEQSDNGKPTPELGIDPFDPDRLRLSQSFGSRLGVKKVLVTIPVKKPEKHWFVRVHPSEDYRIETLLLELRNEPEIYLIDPALWSHLATESTIGQRLIVLAVNRNGDPFLWPVKLPAADGRKDEWSRSMLKAVDLATKRWVRVQSNMGAGAYEVFEAIGPLTEPTWPDLPFSELLRIAFREKFVTDLEHPILKRLRGEL